MLNTPPHLQEEGSLPEAGVARLLLEILLVVDTCHTAGFVHGDVKPANFVLKLHHGNPKWALRSGQGLQGSWLKAIDFGAPPLWSAPVGPECFTVMACSSFLFDAACILLVV